MENALSIDLEFWFCSEFLLKHVKNPQNIDDQFIKSTRPLVKLLDKHNRKATFFVLGMVAEKYPEFIKELHDSGHEIASHGMTHRPLYKLTKKEFETELKKSTELLTKITGERPIGFRAPSFSLNQKTIWALDILEKYSYKYDSSIFPVKAGLYGVPKAPLTIYRPSKTNMIRESGHGIIEFPMTVYRFFGFNIPISGGFYLRLLPFPILNKLLKGINKSRPLVLYLHPWETYKATYRLKIPPISRFVTYYGINSAKMKFEKLLKIFEFKPVREILANEL